MGIGDEIITAGRAREHYQRTGRKVKIVRQAVRTKWFDVWDNLPYILREGSEERHDILRAKDKEGLRPYCAGKLGEQWIWQPYAPPVAEIRFTAAELEFGRAAAGAVLLEPNIKRDASPNKDWGWGRWQQLVDSAPWIPWLQAGPAGTSFLNNVRRIETATFRQAAALLGACKAAVLPEGGLHHAAAALGVPAVVLFGGYISPAVTGYAGQTALFIESKDWPLGCGMRRPCRHCAQSMAAITPEAVLGALEKLT